MSFSSFIFFISDEYSPCGCMWSCECERYKTYNKDLYSVEKACEEIFYRVRNDKIQYLHSIYVNGLRVTYGYKNFNPIVRTPELVSYNNPINVEDYAEYFTTSIRKEPTVTADAMREAVQVVHDLFEAARPSVQEYLDILNAQIKQSRMDAETLKRTKELEELKRLRELYPDA
jgi:hypothetical protein